MANEMRERIITAAVQLFSTQGYTGTATREIARVADVNETSLFRHFTTKQDLFRAAVEDQLSRVKLGKELQACLDSDAEPSVAVPLIVEFLVQTVTLQPQLVRLIRFALLDMQGQARNSCREHLAIVLGRITDYLKRAVEKQRLIACDPGIVVTALVASAVAQPEFSEILSGDHPSSHTLRSTCAAHSTFWLNALVPSGMNAREASTAL